jgi:MFS family permease
VTGASGRTTSLRTLAATTIALAAAMEPAFLLGALSPQIGEDLGLGATTIGAAITAFFVSAAGSAMPLGRLSERLGPQRSLRLGVSISAAVCLLVASTANSGWHLPVLLAVGGLSMGLVEGGSASALAGLIRRGRQGIAFGIKQASVPTAALLAGLSVPLIAVHVGWRAAFAGGAVLAPFAWLALPAKVRMVGGGPRRRVARIGATRPVATLAVGIAMGAAAATAAATFMVPAVTATGITPGAAGIVLAVGSVASAGVRLATGWLADRGTRTPVAILVAALALGSVGAVALAVSQSATMTVAGAVLLLGAGWGWTGLAFLAVVQAVPQAPAAASGIVLTGMTGGSAFGPLGFSALVAQTSYPFAWAVTATVLLLAAAATAMARAGLADEVVSFAHGQARPPGPEHPAP